VDGSYYVDCIQHRGVRLAPTQLGSHPRLARRMNNKGPIKTSARCAASVDVAAAGWQVGVRCLGGGDLRALETSVSMPRRM